MVGGVMDDGRQTTDLHLTISLFHYFTISHFGRWVGKGDKSKVNVYLISKPEGISSVGNDACRLLSFLTESSDI
jgi:hypothetical protein